MYLHNAHDIFFRSLVAGLGHTVCRVLLLFYSHSQDEVNNKFFVSKNGVFNCLKHLPLTVNSSNVSNMKMH